MKELIELASIERLFQLLAIGAPVAGLVIGTLWGMKKQNVQQGAVRGLLFGLLGTANYFLWRVYNSLTDANGLDSVRGLFINFGLFSLLGIAGGIVWAKLSQSKPETISITSTENP